MAPLLNLNPDELLMTTRSVRKRLDLERPVERAVLEECLDVALQAPSGSNSQGWQWVFVTDPDKKQFIADRYNDTFRAYVQMEGATYPEGDPRNDHRDAVRGSAIYLAEHLHEVPVLLIPCLTGRVDGANGAAQAGFWGSILPAVWSYMLALRARGLGSAWTTLHLPKEREVAEALGIPYDTVSQAGLFPIAYTKGTDFKVASRLPGTAVSHWETW
jgi:nitroreductase